MKKIRFFLLLSLMFLGNTVLMAQTPVLQTTKTNWPQEGDVVYSYYVSPAGDEIQHGSFKLTQSDKISNGGTYLRVISGNYKNGYKDGVWTYTVNEKDYGRDNYYTTGTIKLVQSFKDGIPHGQWSYNCNIKRRELLYNGSGYSWGAYIDPELTNVSCSYNNGKMTGQLLFKNDKMNLTGNLNKDGHCIGEWLIKDGVYTTRFKTSNGFITMYNMKGNYSSASEVINPSPQILSLIDSLNTGTASIDEVDKRELQVDIVNLKSLITNLDTYLNGEGIFSMDVIGKGDKSYGDLNGKALRHYGDFMIIKPQEYIPLYTIDEYNEIRISEDHKNVIAKLNDFLKKYDKRLSDGDKKQVFSEIAQHKRTLEFEEERAAKEVAEATEAKLEKEYLTLYAEMQEMSQPSKKQRKQIPSIYNNLDFTKYGYKENQRESMDLSIGDEYMKRLHNMRLQNIRNDEISITKIKEYISYLKQFQKKSEK